MKVTKSQLKQIIKEEAEFISEEGVPPAQLGLPPDVGTPEKLLQGIQALLASPEQITRDKVQPIVNLINKQLKKNPDEATASALRDTKDKLIELDPTMAIRRDWSQSRREKRRKQALSADPYAFGFADPSPHGPAPTGQDFYSTSGRKFEGRMKITKSHLNQIINEELQLQLHENWLQDIAKEMAQKAKEGLHQAEDAASRWKTALGHMGRTAHEKLRLSVQAQKRLSKCMRADMSTGPIGDMERAFKDKPEDVGFGPALKDLGGDVGAGAKGLAWAYPALIKAAYTCLKSSPEVAKKSKLGFGAPSGYVSELPTENLKRIIKEELEAYLEEDKDHPGQSCEEAHPGQEHEEWKKTIAEEKENNPWAICTAQVGREDKEKYEKCVKSVKKQNRNKK